MAIQVFLPDKTFMPGTRPGMRERTQDDYTDAVVTPPSITMVCPVMKVEASEPR